MGRSERNESMQDIDVQDERDSAAVFAVALSIWEKWHEVAAASASFNLSESYNGVDEFMRQAMRIGELFEAWACRHVDFNRLSDVWPYLLQDHFGGNCATAIMPGDLEAFDEQDCLRMAFRMHLPLHRDDKLPIPANVQAANPVSGSAFVSYRIFSQRIKLDEDIVLPFSIEDEPFDEEFGPPEFVLLGIRADGIEEPITAKSSFSEAIKLAQQIAPGIAFDA